ncbi:hypothetical protein DAI22_02g282300 [Oryza sativa Japonica Group]|uniref:Uncharacterized protein n=1 Tax=Oryza sativa subsp. japonica TaxID=39947 RepID=Q6ESP6_ORYSJ|nr:hypothetical protein DAI22_02g282300 [Oryza sativa Japonica Group]BAD28324.1 hypothetical protein [Oryza sativa Japonica Group]
MVVWAFDPAVSPGRAKAHAIPHRLATPPLLAPNSDVSTSQRQRRPLARPHHPRLPHARAPPPLFLAPSLRRSACRRPPRGLLLLLRFFHGMNL